MARVCPPSRVPPLLEPLEPRVLLSAVPLGERIDVAWTDRATGWAEPSVAMHADGRFLVTWKESSGVPIPYPGTSIMGRLFRSDGSPQDEALVLVRLDGNWSVSCPAAAMDANGGFIVAWQQGPYLISEEHWVDRVMAQRFDRLGVAQGEVIQIAWLDYVSFGDMPSPSVAMDADGDFLVTWQNYWDPEWPIMGRLFRADGSAQGEAFVLVRPDNPSDTTQWFAAAMDADGDFAIAWSELDRRLTNPPPDYHPEILAQRFNRWGVAQGELIDVGWTGLNFFLSQASVAMDADGDFLVPWENVGGEPNAENLIMGRLFRADGSAQDEAFVLVRPDNPSDTTAWFAAAMDADGDFVIAWSEYNADLTICHFMAQRFVQPKAWTVMVYLDGDNNLEGAAIDDFLEMASVHNSDVDVVVQFDRAEGYDKRYDDWKTTKRFIMWEDIKPEARYALSDLGEINMGAPGTLESFIDWARDKYPAEHYALILWDHGGGWKGGVCSDDSSDRDSLSMGDLKQSLADVTSGGTTFDVIGIDACLMGGLEVACEIEDYASLFVASAERIPDYGWDYASILRPSDLGFSVDAETWAERLVASYGTYYTQHPQLVLLRNQTLMDADLHYIGLLAEQVSGLADVLMANLASERMHIAYAWNASRHYSDDPLSTYYQDFLDLYDFCDELNARSSNAVIQLQAVAVMSTILPIVLDSCWKNDAYWDTTDGQRCMSIYFPPDKADCGFADYDEVHLSFLADPLQHWDEFLKAYFALPPLTQLWLGSMGGDWNDPGNWSAGINPGPQMIAEFNTPTDQQPVISRNTTIMGVSLETPEWTIGGTGETLSVGTGGIDSAGAGTNTVDPNVYLGSDSTWTVGGGNMLVLNGAISGGGNTVAKDGAGTLVLNGGQNRTTGLSLNTSGGTVRLGGGQVLVLDSLAFGGSPTATLDVTTGALAIDYTGVANPFADVQEWIRAAYDANNWDLPGITSSSLKAGGGLDRLKYAIGYADNQMLPAKYNDLPDGDPNQHWFGTANDKQPVALQSVLVKTTYIGDVNLDGKVDDNDVMMMVLNYDRGLVSTHTWQEGDVSRHDGKIDDNDITLLVLNYGAGWKPGIGGPLGGDPVAAALQTAAPDVLMAPDAIPLSPLVEDADLLVCAQAPPARQTALGSAQAAVGANAAPTRVLARSASYQGSAFSPVSGTSVADDPLLAFLAATSTPLAWSTAEEVAPPPDATLSPDGGVEDLLSLSALEMPMR